MQQLKKLTGSQMPLLALILVVAGVIGFTGVYFAASNSKNDSSSVQKSSCKDTCVELQANKAVPDALAIAVGSFVSFKSADGKSHNLSVGNGGSEHEHTGKFYSGEFKSDEEWRVQFNEEGSFTFHDHMNPEISVAVVVYTPGKDYKVE